MHAHVIAIIGKSRTGIIIMSITVL